MSKGSGNRILWIVGAVVAVLRLMAASLVLGVIAAVLLVVFLMFDKHSRKLLGGLQKLEKPVMAIVFGLGVVAMVMTVLFFASSSSPVDDTMEEELVEVEKEPLRIKLDTTDEWHVTVDSSQTQDYYVSHTHQWTGIDELEYEGKFYVLHSNRVKAENTRKNTEIVYDGNDTKYWGDVYQVLYNSDKDKLEKIYKLYGKMRDTYELDRTAFANLIVNSIQYIPYNLILTKSCIAEDYTGSNIKGLIEGGTPCVPYIKFGVYSPVEFMATFQGDCDTRTTFLYTVLQHFDYDAVILGSTAYKHSVLGINLPASGKHVEYQGTKYYVWETTYYGFNPGIISPIWGDMDNWEVNLPST